MKREFGAGPKDIRRHRKTTPDASLVTVDSQSKAMAKVLFSPQEAQRLSHDGGVCFVDVRAPEAYASGHIPEAINVPESYYLLSETTPDGIAEMVVSLSHVFADAGIDEDRQILVYEDGLNSRFGASCRCYFQLALLGHPNVGILDGGLDRWRAEGYPLSRAATSPRKSNFTPRLQTVMLATVEDVIEALDDPCVKILDNRDFDEWSGAASAPSEHYGADFTPRKGRIPGACWIEWTQFMETRNGIARFKSNDQIEALCAQAGLYADDEIIIYCFKGSRSSNTFIALRSAGFKHVKNYYGSWNEWSRDPELPVMSTRLVDVSFGY